MKSASYALKRTFHFSPAPHPAAYGLAVSWRWLIEDTNPLVVLHDSLPPRYRGFAPPVSCWFNGEPKIGATAESDGGPVLGQVRRPVQCPIKIAEVVVLATECYVGLVAQPWPRLQAGQLPPGTPQNEAAATYSLWRDEQDYCIDWQRDSAYLRRFVDALGWPY